MMMTMLIAAMALQTRDVTVQVRSTQTQGGLRSKVVVEGIEPPRAPRTTDSNGRTTFSGLPCSSETQFWARSDEPSHPNPSLRKRGCGASGNPNVTLRIRP